MQFCHAGGVHEFVESKSLKFPGQGGDATRLRFWDLAVQEAERRPDGGKSGWWMVTPKGRLFALGKLTIPKYAFVYDGRVLWHDGPQVTIVDALGRKFDHDAMLNGDFGG